MSKTKDAVEAQLELTLKETNFAGMGELYRGKVRDVYRQGDRLIMVTTDRVSAFDHVLGYCCVNDVSARDFQFADGQWQRGKSCDDFAPMGPFVATRDEIADPHALGIRFRLNGETMQNSNTDQLIFGVDVLIAEISRHITLEPGDVISTGTPPGVGFARKPPVYLEDGDVMEVEIDGLGVLRNTVRA